MGELPTAPAHLLGLTTIVVGGAAYAGLRVGGGLGAAAGTLFGGALMNTYRAIAQGMKGTPESDKEAMISGTYAVVAALLGGYAAYRASKSRGSKGLKGLG